MKEEAVTMKGVAVPAAVVPAAMVPAAVVAAAVMTAAMTAAVANEDRCAWNCGLSWPGYSSGGARVHGLTAEAHNARNAVPAMNSFLIGILKPTSLSS